MLDMETLINILADKVERGETSLTKVAIAINAAVENVPATSFEDVFDSYYDCIKKDRIAIEEVEEQFCGKKR